MFRRFLIVLSWLAFIVAGLFAAAGLIMLANHVPDATGGAVVMGLLAMFCVGVGMGLRIVGGRP